MTFNQLIVRNIRRQPRVFLSYFFSSVFSVTFFFIASMLYFHPLLRGEAPEGNMQRSIIADNFTTKEILGYALILIAVLALLFLGTMFRLYLKERRQNFSLYLIIGMTKGNLRKMLVLENSLIGISSLLVGVTMGVILSKLMFLIVQNWLGLDFTLIFYLPTKAIIITILNYFVIFSVISIYTLFFIQSKQANMNLNIEDPQLVEPTGNQYWTALGVMLLFFCYLALFSLMKITRWNWSISTTSTGSDSSFIFTSLLVTFLFLAIAVYLFFNQTLVHFSLAMRKWPIMLKNGRVLALSNLSYRLKHNSLVYFLIVISATIAFVAITLTVSLSEKLSYGTDQDVSLAYVYDGIGVNNQKDLLFHKHNVNFIKETIEEAGYQVNVTVLKQGNGARFQSKEYIPRFYDDNMSISDTKENGGSWKSLFLIPLAKYNEMASFKNESLLNLQNNTELLFLSGKSWQDQRRHKGIIQFTEDGRETKLPMNFRFVEGKFNLGGDFPNVVVISDDMFERIYLAGEKEMAKQEALFPKEILEEIETFSGNSFPVHVIDYREWQTGTQIDKTIKEKLDQLSKEIEEELLTGKKMPFFSYKSAYQTKQQAQEERGLTQFLSTIIAAVFFIFSASTIYFRIYGELERDKCYHKTLHIVGVPEKNRNQIVTIELSVLFFLPILVAMLNYIIIMWSLNAIFSFSSVGVTLTLLCLFFGFQLAFFLIVRQNYIKEINQHIQ